MWRAGAAASAAQNGVLAAKLAAEGIAGPREVFLALGAGEGDALPPLGGRGRDFRIEHAHLKAFTAEYHAQAAIGAALSLRERAGPAGIDRVVVNVYAHAIGGIGSGDAKWLVEDPDTALHSLPYLVAVALLDGDVSPAQFTDERLAAADVRGLIRRIELREDAALTAQYVAIVAARVEIVTKSGDTLSASCEQPKGHFENPLTDAEIDAKFSRHAEGRLSATAQRRFLELAWGLEHATGVGELLATLKPDAPTP
jgi:2-methylcitrate dehydratase